MPARLPAPRRRRKRAPTGVGARWRGRERSGGRGAVRGAALAGRRRSPPRQASSARVFFAALRTVFFTAAFFTAAFFTTFFAVFFTAGLPAPTDFATRFTTFFASAKKRSATPAAFAAVCLTAFFALVAGDFAVASLFDVWRRSAACARWYVWMSLKLPSALRTA